MVHIGVPSSTVDTPSARRWRPSGSRSAVIGLSLAGVLALGACSADPELTGATTPASASPSGSAPPTASPTPTSTRTPEEQEAVDGATQAVMAYRQIALDLFSGARSRINDLDGFSTGEFHDREVGAVSQQLAEGWRTTPMGVKLTLVSAEPLKVNLEKDPATVVVRVCIDGTEGTSHAPDGRTIPGVRGELDYTVTLTSYGKAPAWAVSRAQGARDPKDRAC